jgi:cation diffusion facilitator CzcD-associated flavoprotein CzcO
VPALGEHYRIAIVGAGFAGLGMALRLRHAGIEDFVVLERAEELGGTWRDNTYPGCSCDVPSNLYSFSFAPNPDWSRTFSSQSEIWEYLRRVSREHGVESHIRYSHEVSVARWDAAQELWHVQCRSGVELTAEILVAASGALSEPRLPQIEGIERFEGTIFHSARWRHDHDLDGERVAVIGTGSSSIQLVPRIQPRVARLHVFQRTPPWIVAHRERPTSRLERALYRALPAAQKLVRGAVYCARELFVLPFMYPREGSRAERGALKHLESQVSDPQLRSRLRPSYRIGCKRILISNDYYPALQQANVELVTDPIRAFTTRGIMSADGTERELDTIILASGFAAAQMPVGDWIYDGTGRSLTDAWRGSSEAYLGTAVAGFPNMFLLAGPNTGLGHTSVVVMIESQIDYVIECLRFIERRGVGLVEVREEVQRAYNEELQRRLRSTVWSSGGCSSWYLNDKRRNTVIWPGSTWPFRRRLRRFSAGDYHLRPSARTSGRRGERPPVLAS